MNLQQAYYKKCFRVSFLESKGDAFQTFFERLMGLAYPGDFMPCRPWGQQGDQKNDGFLASERTLYQVYAPNELTATRTVQKIQSDFAGAITHWDVHLDKWVFVHNADAGLSPNVQRTLLQLRADHPDKMIETWGYSELEALFDQLSKAQLQHWFGPAPTDQDKHQLNFEDLKVVLLSIEDYAVPVNSEIRDVPIGKIEANALSEAVVHLLKAGMSKAPLVDRFFQQWHDPQIGERVAEHFREKYQKLRGNLPPDLIFSELQKWAIGHAEPTPKLQIAVLAILAYYFESCDIYEAPRETVR